MDNNRVMVFIDGANLYQCIKQDLKENRKVNIETLSHKLVNSGRQLVRIHFYTTPSPSDDPIEQQANQKFLSRLGWINNLQIRKGRIVPRYIDVKCTDCNKMIRHKTHLQKGVDTRIVVDMVTFAIADKYDIAILVSGDSDLTEAVNYIRESTNKTVENACVPSKSWSSELREASDIRIPLNPAYLNDCWL